MNGLASSPFAHHYSGNRGCFLFLWVLRCFTSPRSLHLPYVFRQGRQSITTARFPHSDILGSKSGCRLPEAYRRLLRPSSAPGAKASAVCPYQLGNYRCSRPLCSSQDTGGPGHIIAACPDSRHLTRKESPKSQCRATRPFGGRPVLTKGGAQAPVPSGPNSVLDPSTSRHGFPPASGCTTQADPISEPNNQCST